MARLYAPLTGLFIFALATGYLMTLIQLRLNTINDNQLLAGMLGGIYYIGLLAGSFRTEKTVRRIGHIRAFAGFIALLSASVLFLALFKNPWFWFPLRFLNGMAVASIFVVVESWLLCESEKGNRGQVLAFYMISLYGATAIGQLFVGIIDSDTMAPFLLIGILLSLSVFPPVMTKIPTPELQKTSSFGFRKLYKLTPSGVWGCLAGGIILAGLHTMLPIYLANRGLGDAFVGWFLAITIAGGMALQYPVGYLSDFVDRRKILVIVALLGCIICFALRHSNEAPLWIQMALLFFMGGTTFTLYPLSISHSCDHMQPEDIVSGTQSLLFTYSFGACLGPILASIFMNIFAGGLMMFFISIMGVTGLFFLVRMRARPAIYSLDEQSFVPVPRTSPVVAQIDPRSETEDLDVSDQHQT